jgi:hypothetical protein
MRLREEVGVWVKDRWRYERALRKGDKSYLSLTNRREQLEPAPDASGYACCWPFTSRLHAPMVQPSLGQRLLERCLADAPIRWQEAPAALEADPNVSVLIGHRGIERLPLLLATLETIAAQHSIRFECVVIEQDVESKIKEHLPPWVHHILAPHHNENGGYNRSKAFNDGARVARGQILVLHDNDMLIPCNYLTRIAEKMQRGYDVVNPKRYVFYLNQQDTNQALSHALNYNTAVAEYIVQNLEAGGSMAIGKDGYWQIGGMDESFEGWGGEDNEFWDRCQELRCWRWGYEPIIHLWHPSQPLKTQKNNINVSMAHTKIKKDRRERISELKAKCQL